MMPPAEDVLLEGVRVVEMVAGMKFEKKGDPYPLTWQLFARLGEWAWAVQ